MGHVSISILKIKGHANGPSVSTKKLNSIFKNLNLTFELNIKTKTKDQLNIKIKFQNQKSILKLNYISKLRLKTASQFKR